MYFTNFAQQVINERKQKISSLATLFRDPIDENMDQINSKTIECCKKFVPLPNIINDDQNSNPILFNKLKEQKNSQGFMPSYTLNQEIVSAIKPINLENVTNKFEN